MANKLAALEAELKSRLDVHETAIVEVLQRVMDILDPLPQPEPPKREMGFHVQEARESGTKVKTNDERYEHRRDRTARPTALLRPGREPEAPAMGFTRRARLSRRG